MKIRLVCCAALLGLLISPAMADISVTLVHGPGLTGLVYADIPLEDSIVGFGLDAIIQTPADLSYVGFVPAEPFDPVVSPDGDGFAGLLFPPDVVHGEDVLLGTLTFAGTGSWVDLGVTPGDLTEGFALASVGGFAAATFTGAYIPEPAALVLLALGALALRRR
ncbi:MAG TPA: hypothetical protein PK920_08420 [Phycisphaerae bacterium]|jgi:hypothetical protein|nr:hypothetical protein [Phycisphaerae bacterium]HRS28447.1 hypothetical protein [Phycisphaerae bacterium]HRT42321.1 hypothetical protein [Phycisphaerae bacterium]